KGKYMERSRREVLKAGVAGGAYTWLAGGLTAGAQDKEVSMLVLKGGKFTTLDKAQPEATAGAIADSRFSAVGSDAEILKLAGPKAQVIDLGGLRVIPGLMDSHTHPIRGGLNYNMELRWDGVPSLSEAMRMLREQVQRTPAPQWVRVVGGF